MSGAGRERPSDRRRRKRREQRDQAVRTPKDPLFQTMAALWGWDAARVEWRRLRGDR